MVRGIKKGAALAINQAAIINVPSSFEKMARVGPKVCLTTANEPGFLGFHAFLQTGVHPFGGRFGAAELVMADSMEAAMESPLNIKLNPLNLWQYTVWEDPESHERMHYEQFDRIFELCAGCLDMVVDGPWEPVYRIIEADMPPLVGMTDVPRVMGDAMAQQQRAPKVRLAMKRLIALGEHSVLDGKEDDFVDGTIRTLGMLKENAPGMIGWMILEKVGESALSTFQLSPPPFGSRWRRSAPIRRSSAAPIMASSARTTLSRRSRRAARSSISYTWSGRAPRHSCSAFPSTASTLSCARSTTKA